MISNPLVRKRIKFSRLIVILFIISLFSSCDDSSDNIPIASNTTSIADAEVSFIINSPANKSQL